MSCRPGEAGARSDPTPDPTPEPLEISEHAQKAESERFPEVAVGTVAASAGPGKWPDRVSSCGHLGLGSGNKGEELDLRCDSAPALCLGGPTSRSCCGRSDTGSGLLPSPAGSPGGRRAGQPCCRQRTAAEHSHGPGLGSLGGPGAELPALHGWLSSPWSFSLVAKFHGSVGRWAPGHHGWGGLGRSPLLEDASAISGKPWDAGGSSASSDRHVGTDRLPMGCWAGTLSLTAPW